MNSLDLIFIVLGVTLCLYLGYMLFNCIIDLLAKMIHWLEDWYWNRQI